MINNKFFRAFLAVAFAFSMWLYVITVEVPEDEVTYTGIPVTLSNETMLTEERNLMITTEEISTVSLTLKGQRTALNKLSSSNISAVVDLSQVYEAGTQRLTYKFNYPPDFSINSVEVIGSTPNSITLDIEKRVVKDVPVVVEYIGELPENYTADTSNHELSTTVVKIDGPSSVVDQITQAVIEVDLTERMESFVEAFEYTLCNEAGEAVDSKRVVTDTGEVEVKLKIQMTKEIPLELTVVDGGGATKNTSKIGIDPATIKVSGSKTVLDELNVINIGTINLADYTKDTDNLVFSFTLPDNVTNVTNVTEAKVSVKFPDLGVKTLAITNIKATNVPEGMDAVLDTKALTVTVRGPKAQIDAITDADISASVDLSNAQIGSTSFDAVIEISSTYSGVGSIGKYSVTVTLKTATEATTP